MGRNRCCCKKQEMNIGAWSADEDKLLSEYILRHGEGKWRKVASITGLKRCGKSCRLRWLNYLRPGIKRGNISLDEEDLIIRLHKLLGNRWSLIAGRLPGRTDNEIKNYWNTKLSKRIHKNDNPIHLKQQCKNIDGSTSQLVSPKATLSITPKMALQQRESEDKDCDPIQVPKELCRNNSEGSSLFEGEADLNMLRFDPKDFILDFEEMQKGESKDKDYDHIQVPEEFYQNNSEGSSLFEGEADLNMLSFDPKNFMLDFEIGELYISNFFQL